MEQRRLVNGSLGIVVDFLTADEAHEVQIEIAEMEKPKRSKAALNYPTTSESLASPAASQSQDNIPLLSSQLLDCDCDPMNCQCRLASETEDGARRWPVVQFTNGEKLALRQYFFLQFR